MMNPYFLIAMLSLSAFVSCVETADTSKARGIALRTAVDVVLEIPDSVIVEGAMLCFNNLTSEWMFNDHLFSGYLVSFYRDGTLKEKTGVLNGKKQNQSIHWYPDGHYKVVENYHEGKLHGEKKLWSSDVNHTLIAHLNYDLGKGHGAQKIWYPTGEIFKKINLNKGKEEGIQRAYRKNGDLYANYEAREGRIFGLKKAALCFGLEDEIVQYEN